MIFTDDRRAIQASLERFINDEINPHVDEWEAAGQFPSHELFKKMGRHGLLGINKPVKNGGLGLDYSYAVAAAETLGLIRCGAVPMAIGVQTDMATPALAKFGSEELRAEFLSPSVSGDYIAAVGVSEPGAGSDVAGVRTNARRDGEIALPS